MENFKVVCVNDKFKPDEFPANFWIKKGEIYTVTEAKYLANHHMTIGYKLYEIEIPSDCPYKFFLSNRFRPYSEDDAEAEKAVEQLLKEIGETEYA